MHEDRMPTLFEILNRFSKAPVDLWSFYVYLKEHYGGVEYLEFWLDCAAHQALCKDVAKGVQSSQLGSRGMGNAGIKLPPPDNTRAPDLAVNVDAANQYEPLSPALTSNAKRVPSGDQSSAHTPSSSVLFDILRDDGQESVSDFGREHQNHNSSSNEERDAFDIDAFRASPNHLSTLSWERARNKRDTVSRLSEILDTMQMPSFPNATATSPTRNRKTSQELDLNQFDNNGYVDTPSFEEHNRRAPHGRTELSPGKTLGQGSRVPPSSRPPSAHLTSQMHAPTTDASNPYLDNLTSRGRPLTRNNQARAGIPRTAIRNSALRIINTYLTSKAPKEIELPTNQQGWSMAEDIRQLVNIPGGLDDPRIFENATTYVFEALEREALPGFLYHSALSNVQPVSATFRLIGGLVALFGAFWLSFVYILLDWQPKSHRCWVILPFSFGWYLTITGLYHIDPILAMARMGEKDGGGLARIQEKFVWKILNKRGVFVIVSTVLLTAAFCVLFILVPGHRL